MNDRFPFRIILNYSHINHFNPWKIWHKWNKYWKQWIVVISIFGIICDWKTCGEHWEVRRQRNFIIYIFTRAFGIGLDVFTVPLWVTFGCCWESLRICKYTEEKKNTNLETRSLLLKYTGVVSMNGCRLCCSWQMQTTSIRW